MRTYCFLMQENLSESREKKSCLKKIYHLTVEENSIGAPKMREKRASADAISKLKQR